MQAPDWLSYDEFRNAVGGGGAVAEAEEWSEAAAMVDGDGGAGPRAEFHGLVAVEIPELAEVDESEAVRLSSAERSDVPQAVLEQLKVKAKPLAKFDELWRSSGIATKHKCSCWGDRLDSSRKMVGARNRIRVCLGHYGSSSYSAPKNDRYTLELTDLTLNAVQQSRWLPLAAKQCMPHPIRFHRVWGIQTGVQPLFVWEPVPHSADYVALGMVVTTKEDPPPPVRTVHCVPRDWVEPAPELTKMLWSDSGTSGKAGSLWAVGSLQLLAAAQGQQAPGDKSWRLKRTRFTLSDVVDAESSQREVKAWEKARASHRADEGDAD